MTFPKFEIRRIGGSYAFILTESGELKKFKIRADHARAFNTDLGRFQIKKEHRYKMGRGDVFWYDQKSENPIDIAALQEIRTVVESLKRDFLPPQLTCILSGNTAFPEYLPVKQEGEGKDAYNVVDGEKVETIIDEFVAKDDELILVKEKPKVTRRALRFLANYYHEDVQVHLATVGKMLSARKYRAKTCMPAFGMFSLDLYRKEHIAIVIINNKGMDAVPAKLERDFAKNEDWLVTKKYGRFKFKDVKTRITDGKSNLYVVAVRTIEHKPKERKVIKLSTLSLRRKQQ